jgi:hypothetical protein
MNMEVETKVKFPKILYCIFFFKLPKYPSLITVTGETILTVYLPLSRTPDYQRNS